METLDRIIALFDLRGVLTFALIFIPLERAFALHKEQKVFRRWWWNDLVYHLLNRLFIKAGVVGLVVAALALSRIAMPEGLRNAVAAQSLWLQVIAVTLLADLCFYLVHRLFHEVPWLWNFHAVHHSIVEMDWLAAARVHPIDQILTKGSGLMIVFALGFSAEAIAVHATGYALQSYFVHSNVRFRCGGLRWLLAAPGFHHWHHANQPEAHNKNYAGQLPMWDLLFGTLYMPEGVTPAHYGVDDPVPPTYLRQLVYPFRRLV